MHAIIRKVRYITFSFLCFITISVKGGAQDYDHDDMVGSYKYNEIPGYRTRLELHLNSDSTFLAVNDNLVAYYGNWTITDNKVSLHFNKVETDPLQGYDEWGQYVEKELEIINENKILWGHFAGGGNGNGPNIYLERYHNDLPGDYCFESGIVELSLYRDYTYSLLWDQYRVAGSWYIEGKYVILKMDITSWHLFHSEKIKLRIRDRGRLVLKKPHLVGCKIS